MSRRRSSWVARRFGTAPKKRTNPAPAGAGPASAPSPPPYPPAVSSKPPALPPRAPLRRPPAAGCARTPCRTRPASSPLPATSPYHPGPSRTW
jgi:hypothetical protein